MKGRRKLAFLPDEAIDRSHEINQAAFRLYCYYCKRRNKQTGTCYPSLSDAARALKMAYSYASEMRHQLIERDWISVEGQTIKLLVGFGISEDRRTEKPKGNFGKTETAPSEIPKANFGESEIDISEKPKPLSGNPKQVSEKPKGNFGKTEVPYKEEPAQLTSPIEPEHRTNGKAPSKNPAVEPWYGLFQQAYAEAIGGFPYEGRTHDFVQLRAMLGKPSVATWLTAEKWSVGLRHYFESELGSHTLADFATRFGDFYKNALDRFGKPVRLAQSQPEMLRPLYVPDEPIADDDPNYVTVKEALSGSYKRPSTSAK